MWGFGYSNGANILAATWIARPSLFERAALLHPLIPWAPDPAPELSGRSALVTSGDFDPICPPEASAALVGYLKAQGVETLHERHGGGHEVRPNEVTAAARFFQSG